MIGLMVAQRVRCRWRINTEKKRPFALQCLQDDCSSSRKTADEASQPGDSRNWGVGYDVTITVPTFSGLPGVGNEVSLNIHTHVREDQIALYGFLRTFEKVLFERLISVSGIGPKLAITILSGMPADEMVTAIRRN